MKTFKEICELLINKLETEKKTEGLCIDSIFIEISNEEREMFLTEMDKRVGFFKRNFFGYYWREEKINPRIKWLKKQRKKTY